MDSLVERLRAYAKDQGGWLNIDETCEQAADRIEALEASIDAKEIESGLTSNGNLWRFWSGKARDLAEKNAILVQRVAELVYQADYLRHDGVVRTDRISALEAELQKAREAALEEAAKVVNQKAKKIRAAGNITAIAVAAVVSEVEAAIRSLSQKEG